MRDLSAEALSPFPATWTLGNKAIPRASDCTVWLKMRLAWLVDFALHWRGIVILAVHLLAFTAIYPMSFLVRYEAQVTPSMWWLAILSLPLVVALKTVSFMVLGSHRGWWRYATFADAIKLGQSATLGAAAVFTVSICHPGSSVPWSVILIDWAMTVILIGGLRAGVRILREDFCPMFAAERPRRSLVVGAADACVSLIREIHDSPRLGLKVVGILDPDPTARGSLLAGVKVLGTPDEFPKIAMRQRIESLLIPTRTLPSLKIRSLISTCNDNGIKVQIVPRYEALLSGKLTVRPRDLDIEDLLHRDPVQLDGESIGRLLRGRVILVTGAAGSIGSELCRQALTFHPARLILLDHSENGLFHLSRELAPLASDTEVIPLVASITDAPRLRSAFGQFRPDVILHAAAHKHVPLMEDSPGEAIKNNVFGTRTVVDEAVRSGVEAFVMISTDKAVRPTSVMGACKRLAEMYVQSFPESCSTRLVTVRFGNVLGSNGSVVPLFQEQIRRGEPVTVTHPEMTRYFMTIPEAAQLVLQAGALGRGGEIFVLDMGKPVKILDLATDLIHLSGQSEEEVEIVFTGLRPGEKLFEELYDANEIRLRTPHPKIFRAQHRPCDPARFRAQLDGLAAVVNSPAYEICDALRAIVPEYQGRHPAKEPCPAKGTGQAAVQPIGRATVGSRDGRVLRDPLCREKNQGPEGRAAVGPRGVLCVST